MHLSQYFLPLLKENPKEAEIVSHRLMLRAGMIRQQTSGIYSWLPLGKKVLDKVCKIIREEQERAGAIEILMPTIQSADLWRESGRYDDYGLEMLRIKDRQKRDLLYGPTNEEMVTDIFRSYIRSYKDLPLSLYHIQWKFRDEIRPRFGVMRSREFLMKDAYSFDLDYEGSQTSYNRMFIAYLRTFSRLGLKAIPMRADTGPIGGKLSHEFIILAETGESAIFCDKQFLEFTVPDSSIDFNNKAILTDIVKQWTSFMQRQKKCMMKKSGLEFLIIIAFQRVALKWDIFSTLAQNTLLPWEQKLWDKMEKNMLSLWDLMALDLHVLLQQRLKLLMMKMVLFGRNRWLHLM